LIFDPVALVEALTLAPESCALTPFLLGFGAARSYPDAELNTGRFNPNEAGVLTTIGALFVWA
jgi:hypothetical protein